MHGLVHAEAEIEQSEEEIEQSEEEIEQAEEEIEQSEAGIEQVEEADIFIVMKVGRSSGITVGRVLGIISGNFPVLPIRNWRTSPLNK